MPWTLLKVGNERLFVVVLKETKSVNCLEGLIGGTRGSPHFSKQYENKEDDH